MGSSAYLHRSTQLYLRHMNTVWLLAVPNRNFEVKLLTEIQHLLKGNVARAVRPSHRI
jgi:hypothetical protein